MFKWVVNNKSMGTSQKVCVIATSLYCIVIGIVLFIGWIYSYYTGNK